MGQLGFFDADKRLHQDASAGFAAAFMMRPTTTPSASTDTSTAVVIAAHGLTVYRQSSPQSGRCIRRRCSRRREPVFDPLRPPSEARIYRLP